MDIKLKPVASKDVEKQDLKAFWFLSARYPVCGKGCGKVLEFFPYFINTQLAAHLTITFDR